MSIRTRQSATEDDESEVNLTPMLDVVFIMLIFFIVTASFVREAGIQVERPSAVNTDLIKSGNILVAISQNGEVWIQKRRVGIDQVRSNIERLLAESPKASVIVQADRKSKNGVFVKVMDQAKQAGAQQVAIAALEESS